MTFFVFHVYYITIYVLRTIYKNSILWQSEGYHYGNETHQ